MLFVPTILDARILENRTGLASAIVRWRRRRRNWRPKCLFEIWHLCSGSRLARRSPNPTCKKNIKPL